MSATLLPGLAGAQNTQVQGSVARRGFDAWQKGEATGDYADFKALLSSDFKLYSHPIAPARGVLEGKNAARAMMALITARTQQPNQLRFSQIEEFTKGSSGSVFLFWSEGKVAGGYAYRGWNAIALMVDPTGKINGFREYFGDVDPSWFQKPAR